MSTAVSDANAKTLSATPHETESFLYDDKIVRLFATATIVWGLVAMLAGAMVALVLVLPWMTGGLPWIAFGRLRPVHTNAALFAFIGNAIFAAVYYSTQRLCKTRMWSKALGRLHFWGWQAIILAGLASFPLGITQGKEFAEMEWPLDVAIAIVWVLFFGVNFMMTLVNRRERHLYISLWFYIATIIIVGLVHIVNSIVLPTNWFHSWPLYAGVQDAFMQWWYGHNLMFFFLSMPFLGLMYYFLPKAAEQPLYSYRVAIIHFWSLVLLTVWAGPHHLHYTALPGWASSLGMVFGLLLWMPSWAGLINGLLTLRGAGKKVSQDPVLKFFFVALIFYGLNTFEGPMLALKSVNALSQYTDWSIAHIHAGTLGWNGFMIFGMLYWLLPRLYETPLWSPKLMRAHFWIGTLGILLYILPIYAAGMVQSWMLRSMDETGYLVYPDFIQTTQTIVPLWWLRIAGGLLYIVGMCLLAANTLMTWRRRRRGISQRVYTAVRMPRDYQEEPVPAVSALANAPVLEIGKRIDVWKELRWHRRWERKPGRIALLVVLALLVASLFEAVPIFWVRSNVPTIATVQPYTPLELAGREIYIAEGCFNCHTQQVRPLVYETQRYGEYSQAGEFVYDHPFQWGSRRIGPDLHREGGRQGSFWHWRHLDNPQQETEGSVMPSFEHLLREDLDFAAIEPLVHAAHRLGAPYDVELEESETLARRQAEEITADIVKQGGPAAVYDKKAIALIAYLQRLGTDLNRSLPAPAADDATDAAESTDAADGQSAPNAASSEATNSTEALPDAAASDTP